MDDFFEKVAAMRRDGQSFVLATVVGRRAPISAHLGDRAIVYADGRIEGFVGGACARDIVRKQALESLRVRQPRLVSIRPDASEAASDPEHVIVPMSCASEGAVDVYVEPFVRSRRLLIVGATPVADALARLAHSLDYDVVRVVDAAEQGDLEPQRAALGVTVAPLESLETLLTGDTADVTAVVASQGHYDEQALAAILKIDLAYVGLVASRKRGATVCEHLEGSGVSGVSRLRYPAGLDLGARGAPEVALSILAEIVQTARVAGRLQASRSSDASSADVPPTHSATATDPICGMEVDIATARYTANLKGTTYYFCCALCRTRFLDEHNPSIAIQR
jgi:xanthine dehydrogenase accessory factor